MAPYDDMVAEMSSLRVLAIQQLLQVLEQVDTSSHDLAFPDIFDSVRSIVATFGEQTTMSAVRYLQRDRAAGGVLNQLPQVLPVDVAEVVPVEQIEKSVSWALRPLDRDDLERAESQLTGSLQRMISIPGRRTVLDNVQRAGVRFARIPQLDACAFCLMLASRGAVYLTEFSAARTTGRSTGTSGREQGKEYHDRCRCEPREVRDDNIDQLPEFTDRLQKLWAESRASSVHEFAAYLREHNPLDVTDVRY